MDVLLNFLNGNWSSMPILIAVVVFIVEHYHHADISLLVNRIKSLDVLGNRLDLGASVNQSDTLKDIKLSDNPLGKNNSEIQENKNAKSSESVEVSDISQIIKYYEFEKIYNAAFGTQLQMMEMIKRNGNQPMSYQVAFSYYMMHQNLLHPIYRTTDDAPYFQFMEETKLLKRENNNFQLTEFGVEFLAYIYMRNYNFALKSL